MSRPMLEVIALSAADATAAQSGGADRLELVTDMAADGLTPDIGLFRAVRDAVTIPVRVMLRLSAGFTAGGERGLAELTARARELRSEGAEEFVLGFLDEDGKLDLAATETVLLELGGCSWTFHRAVDHAADRHAVRRELAELPGLDTYLTAGSPHGVADGLPVLTAEAERHLAGEPGYTPCLLIGGGLRLDQVPPLREAGVDAFHIGAAARPGGWTQPVDADAVRRWRAALDREPVDREPPGVRAPAL
ncbi:copper homeostasis protein CutC [Streptomyces sp. XM4193]|uniref:copper homeostasis protein CutC n=1 Tax=Streptomyces sp. XM4193 TaxID=2929782 RepID=UPI001FF74897|nr:copper homeostasis protein CutC [Streptomyces sp. XM4193]MCK1795328.1 copper homeostasis protein CutC [Streptomyces sp. XM4193]